MARITQLTPIFMGKDGKPDWERTKAIQEMNTGGIRFNYDKLDGFGNPSVEVETGCKEMLFLVVAKVLIIIGLISLLMLFSVTH